MLIYLITHPDTIPDPKITNPSRWKISKYGWRQVKRLSRKNFWKDIAFIFASTEPKAYLPAKYWSERHGIPFRIVKDIDEIRHRRFMLEDVLWKNVDMFYSKPSKSAHGWETASNCLRRMNEAFRKIIKEAKEKNYKVIAIVSHGAVSNLYVCRLRKTTTSHKSGQKKIGSWILIDAEKMKVLSSWKTY